MPTDAPRLPAAAVFDNDGLLLDTEQAWTRAEIRLFAGYGATFTMAHKRDLIGSSHLLAAGKLERMLGRPGEGMVLLDELQALVMEEAADGVTPRPGAVELVDALLDAGVPVGLASNSIRPFVELVVGGCGLLDRFATVVTGDEVLHPKPAPDIYEEVCRRLGAAPAASVALEDSPTGVAAARAAGLRVVGVPYLDDLVLDADVVAPSLADPSVYGALGLNRCG
jgi:HAD superfamily hydrolase (TIGR01509 family)